MLRKWTKRRTIAIGMIVVLSAGLWLWQVRRDQKKMEFYRRGLPETIETAGLAVHGDDYTNLLALVVPWTLRMCAGAIFHLKRETIDNIESQGLAFFQHARIGRGYKGTPDERYYSYAPWQASPIPKTWIGNKWDQWLGLDCIETALDLPRRVGQEARKAGSYFTTASYKKLVVVPSLGVVAITFEPN